MSLSILFETLLLPLDTARVPLSLMQIFKTAKAWGEYLGGTQCLGAGALKWPLVCNQCCYFWPGNDSPIRSRITTTSGIVGINGSSRTTTIGGVAGTTSNGRPTTIAIGASPSTHSKKRKEKKGKAEENKRKKTCLGDPLPFTFCCFTTRSTTSTSWLRHHGPLLFLSSDKDPTLFSKQANLCFSMIPKFYGLKRQLV